MNATNISSDIVLNEIKEPLSLNKFKGSKLALVTHEPEERNSTKIVETMTKFIFGL